MYARGIQLLNFGSIYIETPMLRHFLALLSRLLLSIRYRLFFLFNTSRKFPVYSNEGTFKLKLLFFGYLKHKWLSLKIKKTR